MEPHLKMRKIKKLWLVSFWISGRIRYVIPIPAQTVLRNAVL